MEINQSFTIVITDAKCSLGGATRDVAEVIGIVRSSRANNPIWLPSRCVMNRADLMASTSSNTLNTLRIGRVGYRRKAQREVGD